ncbi:aldo/keto reductase [Sulfurimonas autotrophica]|uniref:Aldo/keto reductase n=1 Tax=Sulfurimonas autotrophica (strain ATCC BAA-671 / DSM 16294 / JCM 11897 / OK10) TaxID=563040 RepID=E0UTV5_SULAO|nr:aldo/keto reductase [Sulfurimonas autotrophica]ADN09399.1 aldo/keto reductase [Sulfurimonas autotrophica DSM 16294]
MQFRYIGKSGLRVSPICLGTMTFGTQTPDEKVAFKIMDKAYDAGVNFFDTAELYPVPPSAKLAGLTEEIVGRWLKTKPRDSIILASKVAGAANGWFVPPIRHGLTAIDSFHIERAIEGSLKRLQTDYIDLYQMHWPDTVVPIEESLKAFDRLVQSGKVRYIGTSNDTAYGTSKALMTSEFKGYARFESIQNNFSLLNRRFLDELSTLCEKEHVSLLPYSPLGGGVLSGKYNQPTNAQGRFSAYMNASDSRQRLMAQRFVNDKTLASTQKYLKIAHDAGLDPVTMATAWSKQFSFVASTIIGATEPHQLDASLAAMDLELSEEVLQACDKVHQEILYPMG